MNDVLIIVVQGIIDVFIIGLCISSPFCFRNDYKQILHFPYID